MEFQQRLYELRKRSGLSQEGLADLLGVSRQAVQKWEAGTSRPDLDNLAALARYFNVSLDYLVTGQEARLEPELATTTIVNNYYDCFQYEYRSKRTLFGLPLVHIRFGRRGMGVAKGVLAVGNFAVGVVALGSVSLGVVSVGGLSLGLLFALGGWAMGGFAVVEGSRWALSPWVARRWASLPWAAAPPACMPPGAALSPPRSPSAARPMRRWRSVRWRKGPLPSE
nr:helix-turn-helix transcriptional regulator [uncultured Flavonifractor sp.]